MSYLYEMSEVQKGIYFDCLAKRSSDYHIMMTVETEELDTEVLRSALNFLVSEQEALRTAVEVHDGILSMKVQEHLWAEISVISCNSEEEAEEKARLVCLMPMELEKAPLFRVCFLKTPSTNYLMICLHHLIADGISTESFLKKLFRFYADIIDGKTIELRREDGFRRFVEAENQKLREGKYQKKGAYWSDTIRHYTAPEFIPEYAANSQRESVANEVPLKINAELSQSAAAQAAELEVSEFMFYLAVLNCTLLKTTRSRNFAISSPFTYRPGLDSEDIIGCYIYNVPLVCHGGSEESFRSILQQSRSSVIGAFRNLGYPANQMLRELGGMASEEDTIFDYTFLFDVYDTLEVPFVIGKKEWGFCAFPGELNIIFQKIGGESTLRIQYRAESFSSDYMELFGRRMLRVLETVCANPDILISEMDVFLPGERERTNTFEKESRFFTYEQENIADVFERRVALSLSETAILAPNRNFSWQEINSMANAVASRLLRISSENNGTKTAAILMENSVLTIASIFGILKAGWTYVPMDMSYTDERIAYIQRDASLLAVLTTQNVVRNFECEVLYADVICAENLPTENPAVRRYADSVAYIEYTSGSTGTPKGVMVENRSVLNTVRDLERRFPLKKGDVYLFKTSVTFDISGTEIYGWLVGKGTLCIPDAGTERDPMQIIRCIRDYGITHINFVPSMLRAFFECVDTPENRSSVKSLRWLFTGGEAISNELVEIFFRLGLNATLENVYGPTEATMWATHFPIRESNRRLNVPIGKPLNEYRLYVMDVYGNLAPPMLPGELCISGAGLARGYLNKPELTEQAFVHNPFYQKGEDDWYSRLYRTGDLARMLPDGNYEFLGRIDTQVKLNGVRIELGEIESMMSRFPGIGQAICVLGNRSGGNTSLLLCYTSEQDLQKESLREFASAHLIPLMVPSDFIRIQEIPRTLSAKVDRKKLLQIALENYASRGETQPPKSEMEKVISEVWRTVLALDSVGIDDNFFEIGGHSVALMRVHHALNKRLGMEIPIVVLLNNPTIRGIAGAIERIRDKTQEEEPVPAVAADKYASGDIAIVGISLIAPGADEADVFWNNLVQGKDCIHDYTDEELRELGIDESLIQNPLYVKRKGRVDGIERFDAEFFGVTPAEVRMMSPQLRLLCKGTWWALEDAGLTDGRLNNRIGIYVGASDDFQWYQNTMFRQERFSDTYQIYTQSTNHFLATRLSYLFDLKGPSLSALSGCSTSLLTVHLARRALLDGECDAAIAGGITVELPNDGGFLYEPDMMFSRDGKCKPFDDAANGTVFSNGMGLVALKRIEDAIQAGDHIYAVIKGSAVSNDGHAKLSFTAPSMDGQAQAIQNAYRTSGIHPETVSYIEAHGTGTYLGDPIEIASLTEAFHSSKHQFCTVGSVKGNLGHTDTAAGVIGLIKTALCLEHHYLPPTVHFHTPNQNIDFANSPFIVRDYGMKWESTGTQPLRAGVNAFGVGGTNVHAILEEFMGNPLGTQRKYNLFPVSAQSKDALKATSEALAARVSMGGIPLTDAAWSSATGRKVFQWRKFFVTDGNEVAEMSSGGKTGTAKRKVCFLFTGQGSQYQGMARTLYRNEDHNIVCALFRKYADDVLKRLNAPFREEFLDALYGDENPEEIHQTRFSQMALFLTEYALANTLSDLGIQPDIIAGHSIGEVTAAAFAGVWSLDDAVQVVLKRSELMQRQKPGVMLAVAASPESVRAYLEQIPDVWLSLRNSTNACVIGGEAHSVHEACRILDKAGLEWVKLMTSHAFHTPMMREAAESLERYLHGVEIREPRIKMVSNVSGDFVKVGEMSNPAYWSRQIMQTVLFEDDLDRLLDERDGVFVELGGSTLCSLARKHRSHTREQIFISMIRHPKEKRSDIVTLLYALGCLWESGAWSNLEALYHGERRTRVHLPGYRFREEPYPLSIVAKGGTPQESSTESTPPPVAQTPEEVEQRILDAFSEILGVKEPALEDNFFDLGGDSMRAASLAAKLRKDLNAPISVGTLFDCPTPRQILAFVRNSSQVTTSSIPSAPRMDFYPVTPAQKRMYALYAMDRGNIAFNLPSATVIDGRIDLDKARIALKKLIRRHELLRTSFEVRDGEVVQILHEDAEMELKVINAENLDFERMTAGFVRPFALEKAPLMRAMLVLTENQSLLLFDVHHIIADGAAVEFLTRDFNLLYAGDLNPLTIQYKDYAVWLSQSAPQMREHEAYWLKNLSGNLPTLEIPSDHPRPPIRDFHGNRFAFALGETLSNKLSLCAKSAGATNYMVALSVWCVLLAQYSGQSEVIVGTPVSGRSHDDIREMVGMFVNMLAIRSFPENDKTYSAYLQEIRQTTLSALNHQDYQFNTLVERLNVPRRLNRNAIFDVTFDYHNMATFDLQLDGFPIHQQEITTGFVADELILTCVEDAEHQISCFIEYSAALYEESSIRRMADAYRKILDTVTEHPEIPLGEISLLTNEERLVLERWNQATTEPFDSLACISELFEETCRTHSRETAIICADGSMLSYADFGANALAYASLLVENGVKAGDVVAILSERNETLLAQIFAVLRLGAAYVPIDIHYPEERISYIVENSGAQAVIAPEEKLDLLRVGCRKIPCRTVSGDVCTSALAIPFERNLDSIAYILFTSGSTGQPKGVAVTQKNLLNFIYDSQHRGLLGGKDDRILCITTPSFDIFAFESIVPLCLGNSVCIANAEEQLDAKKAAEKIVAYHVTHFQSAVSRLRAFVENPDFLPALKTLRYVMSGGEEYPQSLLRHLQKNSTARLYNMYGPTETTIWSTVKELTNAENVTIGCPISNTQLFVVNSAGKILPRGIFGELCIAGFGVSSGYVNQVEETERRFRALEDAGGIRVYYTGDRARLLPDGEVQLAGRMDSQVKIHGNRVELGEIERTAIASGLVRNAAACVKGQTQTLRLFYDCNGEDVRDALWNFLTERLPTYMLPGKMSRVKEIPLLPNGKIDRKALEHLDISETPALPQNSAAQVSSETERQILTIWQELLDNKQIGVNDNFFDVGGNSFTLMMLSNRLNETFGSSIELMQLFEYTTVRMQTQLFAHELPKNEVASQEEIHFASGEIAVIGMACQFPDAENIEQFWKNLIQGKESVRTFTEEDLRSSGISEQELANPNYVRAKGYLDGADCFDASFFSMTERDAQVMDPQIRLLLQCCWHALEDACCDPHTFEGEIALFAGSSSNAMWLSQFADMGRDNVNLFSAMTLNERDFLTTQISYKLNLHGPSVNVQTACSTSLVAIHQAARCLMNGDADMALAGGVSITYPRKEGYLWQENMIYSRRGHCGAFSDDSDGTVAGNGCGVVVLKPLETAIRDGDPIYAVLCGSAINNDGAGKNGYTTPSIPGERKVIERALAQAHMKTARIGYVEAHGTGTKLGDPVEIEALKQAWRSDEKQYCAIASVKSNIGHLDAAAGVAGFIKAVQTLHYRMIPPAVNFHLPNPLVKFEETPFYVPLQPTALAPRYDSVAVSAFGIGGTNAHAILREFPELPETGQKDSIGMLLFSAKSSISLQETANDILQTMREKPLPVSDVAFTLCRGRSEFEWRTFAIVRNGDRVNRMSSVFHVTNPSHPRICLFDDSFPELCEFGREMVNGEAEHVLARHFREELNEVLLQLSETDSGVIRSVLNGSAYKSEEELSLTALLIAVAAYRTAAYCGFRADRCIGIRRGAAAAAVASGDIDIAIAAERVKNGQWEAFGESTFSAAQEDIALSVGGGKNSILPSINANSKTAFLQAIAVLWCDGTTLDRSRLNQGKLIHLPGYAFEKNVYPSDVTLDCLSATPQKLADERIAIETPEQAWKAVSLIWQEVFGGEEVRKESNFMDCGGDSLTAIRMAALISSRTGVPISQPVISSYPQAGQLAEWLYRNRNLTTEQQEIKPLTAMEFYETSFAQKRLYTASLMNPNSIAYNLATAYVMQGEIDKERMKRAFSQLMRRHESLRTFFRRNGSEVVQCIAENTRNPLSFRTAREDEIERIIREFVQPFHLEEAPLIRVQVVSSAPNKHYLLIDMHHIISDQSSLEVLTRDFCRFYAGEELEPLLIHYKDFAKWQNQQLEHQEEHLAYWINRLGNDIPVLSLHRDFALPSVRTDSGKTLRIPFGTNLSEKITSFMAARNMTPYPLMFGALEMLLWKYSGQKSFVIGTAVEGRNHVALTDLVGMFVNNLAIRCELDEMSSVDSYLDTINRAMLDAFQHQDCQYDRVVEEMRKKYGITEPLYQVAINYVSNGTEDLSIEGLRLTPYEGINDINVKAELLFNVEKRADGYFLSLEYSTELYADATARRLAQRYIALTEQLLERLQVSDIEIPLCNEDMECYRRMNRYQVPEIPTLSLAKLFQQTAERCPEKTALIFQNQRMTYAELDKQSDQLMNTLLSHGVQRGNRVALMLESGFEQVIAILATLKCGASYVPIDTSYPAERVKFILEDSGASVLVTLSTLAGGGGGLTEIYADELSAMTETKEDVSIPTSIEDEAYVIYTSGSTGKPKGVAVSGRNILRIVQYPNFVSVRGLECVLQSVNYTFDVSVFGFFAPLLNGASCLIVPKSVLIDLPEFAKVLRENHISACATTTPLFNLIVDYDPSLLLSFDKLMIGGETLSVAHVKAGLEIAGAGRLVNAYGPSETAIIATYYPINEVSENCESIPIGYPASATSLYVLDEKMRLLPPGMPGELYIGGEGVAIGYVNRDDLTLERFLTLPFGNHERVYKSGDRVILREDGSLIFCGRTDFQVKVNGFRIELGEIERAIDKIRGIREAVAVVSKDSNGRDSLRAYYSVKDDVEDLSPLVIRKQLSKVLPDYMIPSRIVALDNIPLNVNGKIDHVALSKMDNDEVSSREERKLSGGNAYVLERFRETLGNRTLSETDDIFQYGGNSLVAIDLAQKFRADGYEVTVQDIFEHHTAAELGRLEIFHHAECADERHEEPFVEEKTASPEEVAGIARLSAYATGLLPEAILSLPPLLRFPLSPIQELHRNMGGRVSGLTLEIPASVSDSRLKECLSAEILRHQFLHTARIGKRGDWTEMNCGDSLEKLSACIVLTDIRMYASDIQEQISRAVEKELFRFTPKADDVMWRLCCLRRKKNVVVIWVFDHICFDAISADVIRRELSELIAGRPLSPALPYSEYVEELQSGVKQNAAFLEKFLPQLRTWERQNATILGTLDWIQPPKVLKFRLDVQEETSPFPLLIQRIVRLLQTYFHVSELPLMTLTHGRQQKYNNCVGEFLDVAPILIGEADNAAQAIEEAVRELANNGVNCISMLRQVGGTDVLQTDASTQFGKCILFNFQGVIHRRERDAYEQATAERPLEALSAVTLVSGLDEDGIYLDIVSAFPMDMERLKEIAGECGFRSLDS